MIDNTTKSFSLEDRKVLWENIVLSGGSTMFENMEKRLQKELEIKLN